MAKIIFNIKYNKQVWVNLEPLEMVTVGILCSTINMRWSSVC